MPFCTIDRYHNGTTHTFKDVQLPAHVTYTGNEDFFALACNDARMVVAGMRERDTLEFKPETPFGDMPKYRIKSVRVE